MKPHVHYRDETPNHRFWSMIRLIWCRPLHPDPFQYHAFLSLRSTLGNFKPLEGTPFVKTRPRAALVFTRIWGGGENEITRTLLIPNRIFVLLLFIKVAISCSVDLVYYICQILLLKLFRWMRAANTVYEGYMFSSTVLDYAKNLSCDILQHAVRTFPMSKLQRRVSQDSRKHL
jgi:hypothetical protein